MVSPICDVKTPLRANWIEFKGKTNECADQFFQLVFCYSWGRDLE